MCVSTLRTRELRFTDIEAVNEPVWVRKARRDLKKYGRMMREARSPGETFSAGAKISTLRAQLEGAGYFLTRD